MKPVTYTTVFSFILLCLLSCRESPKEDNIFITANNLYSQQEYEQCIALISEHESQKTKNTPEQQFYLSNLKMNSLFNLGYYNRCNKYLDTMLIKYPEKGAIYSRKAACYNRLKEYDSAINNYSIALNFEKYNTTYLNNRGLVFIRKGKLADAMKDFDSAILLDSSMHSAYNGKGIVCEKKVQYDSALIYYSKAISLQKHYVYLCNRGILYLRMKLPAEGIGNLTESIALNEKYTLAITNKGYGFEMLNNYDSACVYWKKAIDMGNNEALNRYKTHCNK
ncbi:MAG TPA: hypothetical protein VEC12_11145 [Bacteroidia bacterium]|nr:hypothetical protein [Bacteroidia bacterium]